MKLLKDWSKWEITWLVSFSIVAVVLSILWNETLFGFSVFLTGIFCVVLVAKGSIWNYVWGVYNVIGYSYIAYNNGYFGEVMLNIGFFLPVQFIGWFMWKKHLDNGKVLMKRLSIKSDIVIIIGSCIIVYFYGFLLEMIKGQNAPYLDSMSTVFSVIATIFMLYRYTEQWLLWILVDVASVIMWILRINSGVEGAGPMIAMWSAYLINAIYGYYIWRKNSVLYMNEEKYV